MLLHVEHELAMRERQREAAVRNRAARLVALRRWERRVAEAERRVRAARACL